MVVYVCRQCGKKLVMKPGQITTSNVKICCECVMEGYRVVETWKTAVDALYSPNTTWHVFRTYVDIDLEMWECLLYHPGAPSGEIGVCYAWAVRDSAQQVQVLAS